MFVLLFAALCLLEFCVVLGCWCGLVCLCLQIAQDLLVFLAVVWCVLRFWFGCTDCCTFGCCLLAVFCYLLFDLTCLLLFGLGVFCLFVC